VKSKHLTVKVFADGNFITTLSVWHCKCVGDFNLNIFAMMNDVLSVLKFAKNGSIFIPWLHSRKVVLIHMICSPPSFMLENLWNGFGHSKKLTLSPSLLPSSVPITRPAPSCLLV
jgi:hypothetical protein